MKLILVAALSATALGVLAVQRPAEPEALPVMQTEIPRIVVVAKREHGADGQR